MPLGELKPKGLNGKQGSMQIFPALYKEDLNLNITESLLSIEASFKLENHIKGSLVSFEDKQIGKIKRKISLPEKVLPQEATAKLENGILRVEIPKLEK
jgi:HSP20 family protein